MKTLDQYPWKLFWCFYRWLGTNEMYYFSAEVKKLESLTDLQEDDVSRLKDKLDDMQERYKAMESTLQNAYRSVLNGVI